MESYDLRLDNTCQLHGPILSNQNVASLEVSVEDSVFLMTSLLHHQAYTYIYSHIPSLPPQICHFQYEFSKVLILEVTIAAVEDWW